MDKQGNKKKKKKVIHNDCIPKQFTWAKKINVFYSYSLEEQIMQRDNGVTMSMLSN